MSSEIELRVGSPVEVGGLSRFPKLLYLFFLGVPRWNLDQAVSLKTSSEILHNIQLLSNSTGSVYRL